MDRRAILSQKEQKVYIVETKGEILAPLLSTGVLPVILAEPFLFKESGETLLSHSWTCSHPICYHISVAMTAIENMEKSH